jgi:outer membrane murein-binding lipoprotein Lpp
VSIPDILGIIGWAVGIAGGGGMGYVALRGSVAKNTIQLLQDQADALEARIDELERNQAAATERAVKAEEHAARCDEQLRDLQATIGQALRAYARRDIKDL